MGLQLPERRAASSPRPVQRRRPGRLVTTGLLLVGLLVLSGCSEEGKRLAMPDPITEEGEHTLSLWQGAWIAAFAVGIVVWGLIFYVSWRYRRRSADEVPVQTRYNLPLEIFYTIFPIIMVVAFFGQTVRVQNLVLHDDTPDNVVTVVGQQWSWTFNYDGPGGDNVYESGTGNEIPMMVLPVDQTTRFELRSPDVVHSFGVPGFLVKMDVVPGRKNHFSVTPKTTGEFKGKCYELCGVYHSRMLFDVKVVEADEYEQYLEGLEEQGNVSDEPILGGRFACTKATYDEPEGDAAETEPEEECS